MQLFLRDMVLQIQNRPQVTNYICFVFPSQNLKNKMVTENGENLQTDTYHISAYDKHRSMLSVSEISFQGDGIQL